MKKLGKNKIRNEGIEGRIGEGKRENGRKEGRGGGKKE